MHKCKSSCRSDRLIILKMACDYLTMRKTTLFRDGIKEMKMAHNQDLNTHVALWNLLIHGSYLPTFEDAFQKWLLSDGSGRLFPLRLFAKEKGRSSDVF